MTLAELLERRILIQKGTGCACLGISEDESGFVKDGNLIMLLKFSTLVSANDTLIYEGAVA
jgi:hypothetical protein